jgi:MFS family permease
MTQREGQARLAIGGAGSAARWVTAYAFAVTGDASYFLVLSWAAAQAGGPLWSGLVLAAGAIPRAVLMLPGGVLVDRVGPRRLVVGSDALRTGVMLLAAVMALVAGTRPWWLLVVAIVFGIVDAAFMPAVGAMPASLVPVTHLKRLQAWRLAAVRVSNAVGPAAGALLIAQGATTAFAVIAFAFAVSVTLLLTLRMRVFNHTATSTASERPRLKSTIPEIRQQRGLGRLVIGTALTELPFSGPVAVGIVLLTQERHWPVTTAGAALTIFSIAGLLASLLCAVIPARLTGRTTAVAATACTVVLLVCASLVPGPLTAVITCAALGLTSGTTTAICHGQIQQRSPRQLLGRVTAILSLLTLGISPVLYAGAGAVASAVGIEPFFYAAAAIVLLAVGVLASTRSFAIDNPHRQVS